FAARSGKITLLVTPLVSILIPCHNAAPWLAQTLDSALAQTWPHREIIMVDDGSTDGSLAIAQRYETRGVRVLTQPNRGAAAARNRALIEARGDFLQFLDADDLISPDKITAQVALLANCPPLTLATCAWGRFTDDPAAARFVDHIVFRDFTPLDFLILAARTGAMMHPSAWLVPRPAAERAGPWDESLTLNDDGEYFCRVILASAGIAFSSGGRSYYRSGLPGSLSRRRDPASRQSVFRSLQLIERHLLAREDSPRTRRTVANHYQRFIHDFFPSSPELMRTATAAVARLGGSDLLMPPMGRRTAALARLLGWKHVWRLKSWLKR
ncbi:MAG TPA: glycosyltransferase family A protein, partial [Opitutaceae bacterium]|nr:glycosyltransferase family A protein [Opitutaceae bacterium]